MFQKREKYMLFRYLGLVCVMALGVLSTLGSGGGGGNGGGNGGGGTAPNISNLNYTPTGAFLNDGDGSTTVNGSIDFSDPDGDIASYVLTITDSSNNVVASLSDPIPGVGGVTNGNLFITLLVNTTVVDDYTVTVYLIDSANNASNTLTGLFPIVGPTQVSSNLPDTGVDKCYNQNSIINCPISEINAFYGQDNHYSSNPMSFTNNGDGTITDNVTSLMWQRIPDGIFYHWYDASGTFDATYNPGTTDICGDLTLAGYTDWRLPEKNELQSIVDYGIAIPAIDITYFPNTDISDYWTNTEYNSSDSWHVKFTDGSVVLGAKNIVKMVHCVRGAIWGNPTFSDNGDGTVTDTTSGLMWQKTGQGTTNDWQEMLGVCSGLSLAGYTDWRLPDIKELVTTINAEASLDILQGLYCSSTTIAEENNSVWVIQFSTSSNYGEIFPYGAGNSKYFCNSFSSRCVR